ncbi:MAG: FGLLP motif-containing membrane protein [Actinomycetota bacterium]
MRGVESGVRRLAMIAGALLCALSAIAATNDSGSTPEPTVDIYWTWDYDPLAHSSPAMEIFIRGATACQLPAGSVGPDDTSRGVRVAFGGRTIYETGVPHVLAEFDGFEITAYSSYFAPDAFWIVSILPWAEDLGAELELGSSTTLVVECQSPADEWVTVVDQTIAIPTLDDVSPFRVGLSENEVFVFYGDFDFAGTAPPVEVAVDGTAVPVAVAPDFDLGWRGAPPQALAAGLHDVAITSGGREYRVAASVGYTDEPTAVVVTTTTSTTTTVPPTTQPDTTEAAAGPTTTSGGVTPRTTSALSDQEVAQVPLIPLGPSTTGGLRPISEVRLDLGVAAESMLYAGLVMLFIGFQSDLVNKTIEANRDRFAVPALARSSGWPLPWAGLGSGGGSPRPGSPITATVRWLRTAAHRLRRFRSAATLVVVSFLLALGAVASTSDTDALGARLVGTAVAILIVATTYAVTVELVDRRHVVGRAVFRLIPWTIIPAVILVVASRSFGWMPPYLYGLVAGFIASDALAGERAEIDARRSASAVVAGGLALLGLAAVAVIGFSFLPADGSGSIDAVVRTVAETIYLTALLGVLFGLMPLSFMDGHRIWRWSRLAWIGLYGVTVAVFVYTVVLQHRVLTDNAVARAEPSGARLEAALLFVVFAIGSFGFWAYFRWWPQTPRRAAASGARVIEGDVAARTPNRRSPLRTGRRRAQPMHVRRHLPQRRRPHRARPQRRRPTQARR